MDKIPEKTTASEQAKLAGLKGLAEVSELTNVAHSTLGSWHHTRPALFKVVLVGCRQIKKQKALQKSESNTQANTHANTQECKHPDKHAPASAI